MRNKYSDDLIDKNYYRNEQGSLRAIDDFIYQRKRVKAEKRAEKKQQQQTYSKKIGSIKGIEILLGGQKK